MSVRPLATPLPSPRHPQLELSQFCLFSYYKMLETNVGRMLESTDQVGQVGSLLPLPLPVSMHVGATVYEYLSHHLFAQVLCHPAPAARCN